VKPQPPEFIGLLEELHNISSGRIFMMGCGPSLLKTKGVERLIDEDTFVCNRMALWGALPFIPTYMGLTEPYNAEQIDYYDEITQTWSPKMPMRFVVHPEPVERDGWVWVEKEQDGGPLRMAKYGFAGLGETLEPLKTGRHSPLTLSQIAAWMGYREIYFVGTDFWPKGYCFDLDADPGMVVTPRSVQGAAESHLRARQDFEAVGGVMFDCTPGGFMNATGKDERPALKPMKGVPIKYKSLEEVLDG
jgi:hypothetical protein